MANKRTKQKIDSATKKAENQLSQEYLKIDFSNIPKSDQFQKVKVKPPRRWFNSLMAIAVAVIGICLGVIIAYLILYI